MKSGLRSIVQFFIKKWRSGLMEADFFFKPDYRRARIVGLQNFIFGQVVVCDNFVFPIRSECRLSATWRAPETLGFMQKCRRECMRGNGSNNISNLG
jgi:hypothetical protein